MKEIILLGILFVASGFIIDYFLKEKFNIDKKRNEMSKSVRRVQSITISMIFIIFMVLLIRLTGKNDNFNFLILLIPYFVVVFSFQTIMEWLYNRKANLWLSHLASLLLIVTFFIVIRLMGF